MWWCAFISYSCKISKALQHQNDTLGNPSKMDTQICPISNFAASARLCIPRGKNRGVSRWVGDLLEWLLMGSISADHTWNVLYAHVLQQHIPRNSRKSPFKSCTKASWLFALSLLLPPAPFQFCLCKPWFPHREIFGILTQINTSFPASYVDVALGCVTICGCLSPTNFKSSPSDNWWDPEEVALA